MTEAEYPIRPETAVLLDGLLVTLVLAGDQRAAARLHARWHPRLLRTASADFIHLVSPLSQSEWDTPTALPGWTVGDLVAKSDRDLASIPNFGRKSIDEIRAALAAHGLRLRGDEG